VVIYIFGRRLGPDTYVSLDEHMRSVFYLLERVCAEVLVDPMDKFTIVYNRVDVDNAKSDQDWVKAIAAALGNHYPERMKRCLVYPSNAVFRYVRELSGHITFASKASTSCLLMLCQTLEHASPNCVARTYSSE